MTDKSSEKKSKCLVLLCLRFDVSDGAALTASRRARLWRQCLSTPQSTGAGVYCVYIVLGRSTNAFRCVHCIRNGLVLPGKVREPSRNNSLSITIVVRLQCLCLNCQLFRSCILQTLLANQSATNRKIVIQCNYSVSYSIL